MLDGESNNTGGSSTLRLCSEEEEDPLADKGVCRGTTFS